MMTFDEVNTRIDQPMEHDIHRGIVWYSDVALNTKNQTKQILIKTYHREFKTFYPVHQLYGQGELWSTK
jgi:hypothetical protein